MATLAQAGGVKLVAVASCDPWLALLAFASCMVFRACAAGVAEDPVIHGVVVRRAPGQRAPCSGPSVSVQLPSRHWWHAARRLGFAVGGPHAVPSPPQCPGLLSPASQRAPLCPHLCPSHVLTGSGPREYRSTLPGLGTSVLTVGLGLPWGAH